MSSSTLTIIKASNSENDWVCDSPKNKINELASKDELSAIMECPYCLEMPLPPVYLCVAGHIVCSNCREKLKKCGLCKSAFLGTRNYFYENQFEKMTFACKYVAEGCKEVMLGKFVKEHQENCDFRPIPCLLNGCANRKPGKYIAYSNYMNHIKEVHGVKVISSQSGIVCNGYETEDWNRRSWQWLHTTYQFKGFTFFVNCQVRNLEEMGVWLFILGTEDDAKNFRVNISIGDSTESHGATTCWEGPVHSIRKCYRSIMNAGQCLSMTSYAIKALSKETPDVKSAFDGVWEVKFLIKEQICEQRSVEAKDLHGNFEQEASTEHLIIIGHETEANNARNNNNPAHTSESD